MAIDPGPVVVDGVDDVLADHHNKQRTALLALETGTTAQTTVGTISTGVWNGTAVPVLYGGTGSTTVIAAQNTLKVTRQILSDPGATISGTTAETTMLSGTKPDIPANTLAVGDGFQFIGSGTMETIGGAASTLNFRMNWDAVNMFTMSTSQVAVGTAITWEFMLNSRVVTIGSSGTVQTTGRGSISTSLSVLVASSYVQEGLATVDTTQALTIDLAQILQSNNASNTFVSNVLLGYYTPKFP